MSEREINVIEQKPSLGRRTKAMLAAGVLTVAAMFGAAKASETVKVRQTPVNAEGIPCSPQDGNEEEVCQPGSTMPDKESSTTSEATTSSTASTTEATTSTTEATTTTAPEESTTTEAPTTTLIVTTTSPDVVLPPIEITTTTQPVTIQTAPPATVVHVP